MAEPSTDNGTVTMPAPLSSGTDWGDLLRNITAYGATRYFDSEAYKRMAQSNPAPISIDAFENFFKSGTKAPNQNLSGAPLGVPLMVWLIGGGIVAYLVLKD